MEAIRKSDAVPAIDIRNVTKVYKVGSVEVNALRGVSLKIEQGEICCIVGRSGSGKSTLLNVMAGLEPVTSGEIVIANKHMERMTQSELIVFRQKHVGFIFQSFNLLPYYTAVENVAFPLSFRGVLPNKRNKLAREMLKEVGLESHMNHKPTQMSGGQQQRVGIARALVTNPDIVFADEPTGNLDSSTSDEVMHMIVDTLRKHNRTLVMVTHDPNMAEYADRVIHLLDGRIIKIENKQ
ncbi:MAG: ABC transporter ATP-binding protein [Eubacteriales bacterium]|nr:ABC transporter ATP-binding protein [Clostridiales bacterium]MDY5732907.1 ABC transporter ATP-binding protein [Eubacteriales bacterium]